MLFQKWCVYTEVITEVNVTVNGTDETRNVTDLVGDEKCMSVSIKHLFIAHYHSLQFWSESCFKFDRETNPPPPLRVEMDQV